MRSGRTVHPGSSRNFSWRAAVLDSMRIQGWTRQAVTVVLLAAAAVSAGGTPASAGAPVGDVVTTGISWPLVDDTRLLAPVGHDAIRVYDAANGTTRDLAVDPAECTSDVYARTLLLRGAQGGYALLVCSSERGWQPRLLDLASGAVVAPAGLDAIVGHHVTFTTDRLTERGIDLTWPGYHGDPDRHATLDWRSGALLDYVAPSAPACPAGGVTWRYSAEHPRQRAVVGCDGRSPVTVVSRLAADESSRTAQVDGKVLVWTIASAFYPRSTLYAYVAACRTRLAWDQASGYLHGGDVYAVSSDGEVRRVRLGGVCARTAHAWGIRVTSGARSTSLQPVSAAGDDAATGASLAWLTPSRPVREMRPGPARRVRLTTTAASAHVRWKSGDRRWKTAAGAGRRWTLRLPARARALRVEQRLADGSRAEYVVKVREGAR